MPRGSLSMAVVLLAAAAEGILAQDYVTTRYVNLRRTPSNTGAKIRTLAPGEPLSARDVEPRTGWVAVRESGGKAGWVGESKVRDLKAEHEHNATVLVDSTTTAVRIDPNWAKPPLGTSTIKVRKDGKLISCPPVGRAKKPDDGTNFQKNRADVPQTSHLVTVGAIRALPDTALWRFKGLPPFRTRWSAADSALVIPYEGIPVTVEGYFQVVKTQSGGDGEAVNCNANLESDTDWHIAFVADPNETEAEAVVVEPTPRTKRHNAGWTPKNAAQFAVRTSEKAKPNPAGAARVRITGWLLMDPVHATHIGKFRATLWEVHPVTKIEVRQNGQWVNLNDVTPPE